MEFEVGDPSHWCVSLDMVVCAFCACISSKVKIFCSLSVDLGVHMFVLWDQLAIVLQFGICYLLKGGCNWSNPKSYNEPCVLIALPRFWVFVSNDPDLGTAFNGACCFC